MEWVSGAATVGSCYGIGQFRGGFRTALVHFRSQSGADVMKAAAAEGAYFLHPLPYGTAYGPTLHHILSLAAQMEAILPGKRHISAVAWGACGLKGAEQQVSPMVRQNDPTGVRRTNNVSAREGCRRCRRRHANSWKNRER